MENCCEPGIDTARSACPICAGSGRHVDRITLKALLRPEALARLRPDDYRFCPSSECPIVYYGRSDSFRREDVLVPVFQKEAEGGRTVCYCFAVPEDVIRQEVEARGVSPSAARIRALVQAGRCACEVRNPQGTCCLGNVFAIARASGVALQTPVPDELVSSAAHE
jgi:hypothetical protein